jgi:hypothetical protein
MAAVKCPICDFAISTTAPRVIATTSSRRTSLRSSPARLGSYKLEAVTAVSAKKKYCSPETPIHTRLTKRQMPNHPASRGDNEQGQGRGRRRGGGEGGEPWEKRESSHTIRPPNSHIPSQTAAPIKSAPTSDPHPSHRTAPWGVLLSRVVICYRGFCMLWASDCYIFVWG